MKLKLNSPVSSRSEKINQRRKRIKGKNARVERLDLITPTNYCLAAEKLETYAHFFTHKKKEDFLMDNSDYLANFKKKFKVIFVFPEMIIDNIIGSKMMESANVPEYISIPRQCSLAFSGSAHMEINCLASLLSKFNKNDSRGKNCSGLSKQYATLGPHCRQNNTQL